MGSPARALEHYSAGVALDPDDVWLRYASGVALRALGRLDDALGAFDAALRIDPRHLKSLQWRADTQIERGANVAALEDLTRLFAVLDESDPAVLAAWGGDVRALQVWTLKKRGLCRGRLGDRDGGHADLVRAAQLEEALR